MHNSLVTLLSAFLLANLTWGAEDPILNIVRDGGNVRVSWPALATGFALEQASGSPGSLTWSRVVGEISQVADRYEVIAPITGDRQYFRLASPSVQAEMVLIPAGTFQLGDAFAEGWAGELPLQSVFVSAFLIEKNLVTGELWRDVSHWAYGHGYGFDFDALSRGPNHPVYKMNWFDVVKWCNARSEKEGLTPVYYTDPTHMEIFRIGHVDLSNYDVDWSANGYRLPTEAEYEKAARGGRMGQRFPWGDTITQSQANYMSDPRYDYDVSPTRGYHPTYAVGRAPFTSPVGSFPANEFGLFDMTGNLFEWCWDWYDLFSERPQATSDPRGLDSWSYRVLCGGAWDYYAFSSRCSARTSMDPRLGTEDVGFRCVRGR